MTDNRRLEHALHNEKVCKYLDKKQEHTDWVITTAFYSAIHFVQHKLFPLKLKINNKDWTFTDFDMYYSLETKRVTSKHKALTDLVEENLLNIAVYYAWLKDASWTARYSDYNHSREISNKAKEYLGKIKECCIK